MPDVLVTGASGYLGQHLVRALCADGLAVRGLARSVRPAGLPAIEWRRGDVCVPGDVASAAGDCAAVVHLACRPLRQSFADPAGDFAVNAGGTLNVLAAARQAGVGHVVYASTAQVYGAGQPPFAEEAPTAPRSPYAASKLCGEVMCTTFARCYGLGITVLRIFNAYGPAADGAERGTVEALFVRRVAQGLLPVVTGHPDEARDFVHVRDVVRAIQRALHVGPTSEVINIGSGVPTTMRELADLVISLAGVPLSPVVEVGDGPPLRIQADTHKARTVLGFAAQVALRDGLAEMLELARQRVGQVAR
ncbi:MAG: NAD-dependent epimerase/dehydratase family protein [Chloroflexi bacterium]|nr:NAD-dependent epimerase/dehydratase family protein [Chloroflexota bacterium]